MSLERKPPRLSSSASVSATSVVAVVKPVTGSTLAVAARLAAICTGSKRSGS